MKALLTRKLGMTNILNEDGSVIAVTLLSAKPNIVTQIKSTEKDGYDAVQVSTEDKKIIREYRLKSNELANVNVGDQVRADIFNPDELVRVTGTSKGKGFAGTIKRHGFARGPKTHGGRSYRRPGSIGSMYPQNIKKGKKMAGHMGASRVTTKNLRVAMIDKENSVIGVKGAVPGPKKGLVLLRGA